MKADQPGSTESPVVRLTQLSASELASRIREGQTCAREVLEAFIQRVEQHNSSINAIVTMDLEEARKKADRADQVLASNGVTGPLHGVPITVKDTWDTQGLRTTIGVPWLKKNNPVQNAVLVERLQQAGAII